MHAAPPTQRRASGGVALAVQLTLRSLAWRRASAALTCGLVALTVLAAALGPLWARAGRESLLRDALEQAGPFVTSVRASDAGEPTTAGLARLDHDLAAAGPLPLSGPPLRGLRLDAAVRLAPGREVEGTALTWREGQCTHVRLTSGRCPAAAFEAVVEDGAAASARVRVGARLTPRVDGSVEGRPVLPVTLTVVGTYRPRDAASPYWTGHVAQFESSASTSDGSPPSTPVLLTTPATFDALAAQPGAERPLGAVEVVRLLDVAHVRLRDVARLRTGVAAATALQRGDRRVADLVGTPLDAAARRGRRLDAAAALVVGQLLLLAGAVLVQVVTGSARARRPEVAAAGLRGLRTRTTVALAVREPLLLVAGGAPVGALGAWAAARLLADARLAPGTPVLVDAPTVAVAAGTVLAVVVTALAVCARVLGRPPLELWERAEVPRRTPGAGAVVRDALLAALLVALAVGLSAAGSPAVLLVPLPLALAGALVAVRVLPLLARSRLAATRSGPRLARFLVVRQLARRGDGARLAALVVVAAATALSATAAWSVTGTAARDRAQTEVAAPVVVVAAALRGQSAQDLLALVDRVDPGGRRALAAVDLVPFANQPGGRLVAVDARRLAAVVRWRRDLVPVGPAEVGRQLLDARCEDGLPVVIAGGALENARPGVDRAPKITGLDGRETSFCVRTVATALPRGAGTAVLVDLRRALRGLQPRDVRGLPEVWTDEATLPAVRSALTGSGWGVDRVERVDDRAAVLRRQGPGLAVVLALVAAGLVVLLVGATALSGVAVLARRRGFELASLAVVGVPARALRRASAGETAAVLALGLLVGTLAGALGAALSLPGVPVFDDDGGGVPPLHAPRPLPLLVLGAAALAVATLACVVAARALDRSARTDRLREAQA